MKTVKGKSIWSELKCNYIDPKGVLHIDAWLTDDDDEEGKTIAYVVEGDVYPVDHRIYTDPLGQEAIEEAQKIFDDNNDALKYEYKVMVWGGLFQYIDKYKAGTYYFDTKEERSAFIEALNRLKKENANKGKFTGLVMSLHEGYDCRQRTVIHRVIEYKGERYYSCSDISDHHMSFIAASYIAGYKWTVGFNDYPLGEDFDYEANMKDITIIQEWITGSFTTLHHSDEIEISG